MGRLSALTAVLAERSRGRFALGSGVHALSDSAFLIAALVAAHQLGGVTAVGIVGFFRVAPAAVMAPFSSAIADRNGRRPTLLIAYLARTVLLGFTALTLEAGLPIPVFVAAVTLVGLVSSVIRPAQWALPPLLSNGPQEITPIMTAWTTLEGFGTIVGPATAGFLIGASGPAMAIWMSAGAAAICAWLTVGMVIDERRIKKPFDLKELRQGVSTVAREPGPRLIIGLLSTQTFVRGLLNVLIVAAAVGILRIGEEGAGYLAAAMGVGGLIGGIATVSFVGKDDLGARVGASLVIWGAPILVIGLVPQAAVAAVMIGLVGLGNAFLDVAAFSLLQRVGPPHALARVFGVLEGLVFLSVSVGSLVAPVLINLSGIRVAHIVTGAILPLAAAVAFRALRKLDLQSQVPEQRVAMLEAIPLFSQLPGSALATLAIRMKQRSVPAGQEILEEGTPGDVFYVIERGEVAVMRGGESIATLGDGDYFGEIALTRDVPRVASVTATSDTDLLSLGREDFLGTVAGNPQGGVTVEAVVQQRLGE